MSLNDIISGRPKALIVIAGAVMVAVIGFFDYAAGKEISVRVLYLIPLAMVTWNVNFRWGVFLSLFSAGTKIYVDILSGVYYSHPMLFAWEGVIVFGIFMVFIYILWKLKLTLIKLEEKNEALIKAGETKTEILSIVAHDLKNPLNNIMAIASLIKEEPELNRGEINEFAGHITSSSNRMLKLINDFLSESIADQDKIKSLPSEFDLCTAAEIIVKQSDEAAVKKGITIKLVKESEPVKAYADEELTLQVIDNLISNAVKFSPAGSSIVVRVKNLHGNNNQSQNLTAGIEVTDSGPGITEKDRGKIFGKFEKLSAKPTAGESSSGMGLFIVKKFVDAMDGMVGFVSEPGKGSTFKVALKGKKS